MMSVSLLPARSPWNVFVMCARASFTPSRSSYGSFVSKRSMSKVPSALLIPVTVPHGADSGGPGPAAVRRARETAACPRQAGPRGVRGERLSCSGRSGPVLDDVQVVEDRLPVGQLHVLRGSGLRLGAPGSSSGPVLARAGEP